MSRRRMLLRKHFLSPLYNNVGKKIAYVDRINSNLKDQVTPYYSTVPPHLNGCLYRLYAIELCIRGYGMCGSDLVVVSASEMAVCVSCCAAGDERESHSCCFY